MFSKILVPLDGSEHSMRALDIAIQIAKKFNSKLTLIHV
ncbi:MAG: universal stress protein, partial [Candidatus Bathyarchaeia archaeon]